MNFIQADATRLPFADGHPRHPLYVAGNTKLIPFEGTA